MDDIEFDVYNMALRLSGGGHVVFLWIFFLSNSIHFSLSLSPFAFGDSRRWLGSIVKKKKEKKSYVKERDGAPPMGSRETGRSIEATVGLGPMDRDS